MQIRRTKIIATLGPATDSPEKLSALIKAGADILRINLSHGTHEGQAARAKQVREVARAVPLPPDREILHSIDQHFCVDEQERVLKPEGMEGTISRQATLIRSTISRQATLIRSIHVIFH